VATVADHEAHGVQCVAVPQPDKYLPEQLLQVLRFEKAQLTLLRTLEYLRIAFGLARHAIEQFAGPSQLPGEVFVPGRSIGGTLASNHDGLLPERPRRVAAALRRSGAQRWRAAR
jgi:hypothetical protein